VAFPVQDKKIRERVIEQLNAYLEDSASSWLLQPDGSYQRAGAIGGKGVQVKLLEEIVGSGAAG